MSILIKGMEMPTSCDDCEFCKRDISGYDWCCIPMTSGRSKPLDEPVAKPDWCPLIEIQPHGRLIDADALAQAANDFPYGYRGMILAEIAVAPTIIEAEEGE